MATTDEKLQDKILQISAAQQADTISPSLVGEAMELQRKLTKAHDADIKVIKGVEQGFLESFSQDILGEMLLVDPAMYDGQVEVDIIKGRRLVFTSLEESTGWPSYGIKLPASLVSGKTYRIRGTVKNAASGVISLGNYKSLYPDDETQRFWVVYNLAAGSSATIDTTFTYSSQYPYISLVKSALHYEGDSVEIELYIEADDARLPSAEKDIQDLRQGVADNANSIDGVEAAQDSIYTDIYGKKRMVDAKAYDSQVSVVADADKVVFTATEESTGWPSYGIKLPSTLVNGKRYLLRGTVKNDTDHQISIGNYGSLYPDEEDPTFWLVYNLAAGATATINTTLTYDSSKPYLSFVKSMLSGVGDSITMAVNVNDGEDIIGRLSSLEGEEGASCVISNVNPTLKATDGSLRTLLNSGTVTGWTITQETNGVRMVASGSSSNYVADNVQLFPALPGIFEPGTKYGVFVDIDAKTIEQLHEQDVLEINFFFVKSDYTQNSSTMRIYAGNVTDEGYTRSLQSVAFIETGTSSSDFMFVSMKITKVNASGATSEICNILIKRFIIFKVPTAYANYTELDFVALLKNAGQFSTLAVVSAAKDEHANLLYDGMKLKSLGDSLPETVSFQPFIAQALGMKYDAAEEVTDDGNYKRSTMGATRVVPVVYASSGPGATGNSIYMRARSLAHWHPDILIILAGYNDVHAGAAYIDGGTAVEPADYGIDDAPYTGGEVNLLTTPSASVPSFGASYRGMVEKILTDMPWIRLVLCGIPRGSGETSILGTDGDWVAKKNLVIQKIAEEYGFPFVDLSKVYGVNAINYQWLTKDGLHFSDFGGRRVAQEILAKAF